MGHDSMKANANALVQMIPHIIGDDVYLLSPIWYVGYTSESNGWPHWPIRFCWFNLPNHVSWTCSNENALPQAGHYF